jgi:CheY-like chemotaxis protein
VVTVPNERDVAAERQAAAVSVLLVDDSADDTDILSRLLGKFGCRVEACNSGQACLDIVDVFRPQLILLDLGMPGMSGMDVARLLRAKEPRAYLLVARTGYADEATRAKCMEAGFDDVLVKPDDPAKLQLLLDAARLCRERGE